MSYRVTVSNEGYCADTATTKIIIDTIGANIMLPKDTICQNENIILKNTAYNSVNINNKWSLDSAIIISNDGKGTVEVKWKKSRLKKIILTSDGSACDGSDSVSLYVRPTLIPKFSMSDTGCFGQPVVITPDTTDGRYYWSADEQKTIIKDFNPVSFTWASTGSKNVILVLKDKFLCDSLSDSAKVTIYQNPNITLNVIANNRICDGDLITFTVKADGIYSYRWEPNNAFENISGSNAAMTVPGNVNVSVKAINEWGCYANANMVIVTDNCCAVFMPDAFTPNNDGKNDTYRPIGIDNQKIEKYMVLNRWGQVLYEGNNPLEGWDGSLKGEKQDAGIYFYYIKYKCGSKPPIEAKGNFMLMR
jgi:gliding motility-associated-like protein